MPFHLRPATAEDLPRLLEILNQQISEPVTLASLHLEERLRRPEDPFRRLVAVAPDGRIAGYGESAGGMGMKPGHFSLRVRVEAPYRGRGAGGALYGALADWARSQGARRLETGVREEDAASLAWARRRGFVPEYHVFESLLKLPAWDPAPFRAAVARAEAAGFRFTTLAAEVTDEAAYRRYYEWERRLWDDIPGNAGRQPYPYEVWRRWVEENPDYNPGSVFLAIRDTAWAAVSALHTRASGGLYNGFTGVDPAYRGQGLALPTKVVGLLWAREQGYPYVRTHNHSVNQPMLAVNRKLGYEPLPGVYTLGRDCSGPADG